MQTPNIISEKLSNILYEPKQKLLKKEKQYQTVGDHNKDPRDILDLIYSYNM